MSQVRYNAAGNEVVLTKVRQPEPEYSGDLDSPEE
jgi:hypothetical protein